MVINPDLLQQIVAQAQQADWENSVNAVLTKPTAANILDLTTYPDRLEAVAPEMGSDARPRRNVIAALDFLGLMNHGSQDAALSRLIARKRALVKGKESTEVTDFMIGALKGGDPEQIARAKGLAGMVLAAGVPSYNLPEVLHTAGFKDIPDHTPKRASPVKELPEPEYDIEGDVEANR